MQSFKRSNFLIVLLLLLQIVTAQQYPTKNISTLDGLPDNAIYSILKDSRDILWVGTGNGLSKISNGEIKNYYKSDGLAHNNCWSIVEDLNKNLWFASYGGGLTFYDGKKFKVYNVENGLVSDRIRKVFLHNDKVFIGTENGLSVIDVHSKKITNFKPKPRLQGFQIMDFFEHNSEIYILTFTDGLWKLDNNKKDLVECFYFPKNQHFKVLKTKNNSFLFTKDGNWRSKDGINKIRIEDYILGNKPNFSKGETVFFDLCETNINTIFAGGVSVNYPTGGLFEFNVIKNELKNVGQEYGIESKNIWSLFYDQNENLLYVGTLDFGLYTINLNKSIKLINSDSFIKNKSKIVDFNEFQNNKIILTESELIIKDSIIKSKIIKQQFIDFSLGLKKKKRKSLNFPLADYNYEKKIDEIEFRFLKIYNNHIWVNSSIGLFSVNMNGKIDAYYPFFVGEFDFLDANSILFQRNYHKFYLVTNINEDPKLKAFELSNINNPRDVFKILKNQNNHYFVSSSNGIFTYTNGDFYSYLENNIWNEKELKHAILDSKNRLVICNSFGDIFTLKNSKKFSIEFKINNNEIIGNSIQFLESYKDYLIIGTEKGINLYKDGNVILINENDGITKISKKGIIVKDILFITNEDGIHEVNLKALLNNKNQKYKVNISILDVNYKGKFEDKFNFGIFKDNKVELSYNENIISIKYGLNNHTQPEKLRYSYKVEGLGNSNWSDWSTLNIINLPYLPTGNFNILVKIKDLKKGKTHQYKLLQIIINPPFWKTWWFITCAVILFSIIGFLLYKGRINKIKRREEEKSEIQKRLAETKMEALQSQMNPHFIFNAMNSIQNYIIDNNTDDALMYMGEFSKIIRQTLNNSSLQKISLYEDLQYIQSYITIENMRFKDKVEIEVKIHDNIDLMDIDIPPMLIQPFIENAFAHAFDSKVVNPQLKLNYELRDQSLIIHVIDNGKGINENNLNRLQTSKGIKLTKERLSLLNPKNQNSVEIISNNKGTTIIVTFNLNDKLEKQHDN